MNASQQAEASLAEQGVSTRSLIALTLPAALSAMLNNANLVIDQYVVQ